MEELKAVKELTDLKDSRIAGSSLLAVLALTVASMHP